jgi:hypothetical protein
VAAGIALYEAIRQRGSIPSHVRPIPPRAAAAGSIVAPGPDDDVHDPGHVQRPSYAGSDEEAEEDPVSLVQIEDEEQYTAPEVVHVRTHSRDTRGDRRHGGRGRFDRRHRPKPAAPNARPTPPPQQQAPAEGAAGAPAPQNREGRGRKRRRRRGKGRDGAPGAPGAGPAASGHAPPSSHSAQVPPTSNGETPSGGRPVDDGTGAAQGDKRRRRRRRRR